MSFIQNHDKLQNKLNENVKDSLQENSHCSIAYLTALNIAFMREYYTYRYSLFGYTFKSLVERKMNELTVQTLKIGDNLIKTSNESGSD